MDPCVLGVVGLGEAVSRVFSALTNVECVRFDRAADVSPRAWDAIVASAVELGHLAAMFEDVPLLAMVADDREAALAHDADQVLRRPLGEHQAEASLRAALRDGARRKLRIAMETALELVSDSVEITGPDARLQFVNDAFERMTQYVRAEALGKTPRELLRSNLHSPDFYQEMWRTISERRTWKGSLLGKRKDGVPVTQLAAIRPIVGADGSVRQIVAVKQYVSGDELGQNAELVDDPDVLRAAVAGMVHAERRYRSMMHAATDAILVHDFETAVVLEANPAAARMFGYPLEELRTMTSRQLSAPEAGELISRISRELNETGRALEHRLRMQRKDGSKFWASLRCSTYDFLGRKQYIAFLHEVTELVEHEQKLERSTALLRDAQHQLLHSARLATIGRMAAGVAHEINNPLQCILMGLETFDQLAAQNPAELETASDMREAVMRIRSLTQSLLPFARTEREGPELTSVDDIVQTCARMMQNEIRHRARVEFKLGNPPQLASFRTRLSQLLTNLISNGIQSMEDGGSERNTLTLSTRDVGEAVEIRVRDTGCGMTDEVRKQVFEPFFTTKPAGVGTGLGLALCADIVQVHAGSIAVESDLGKGTSVIVRLPYENGLCITRRPDARPSVVGSGRLLVIDDDPLVLRSLARNLRGRYAVVTAEGGKRGLEILAVDRAFDAVVCDLMMPELDGPGVYAELRAISPELPGRVVFCSGGVFSERVREFLSQIRNPIIDKPASLGQLEEAIAQLLRVPYCEALNLPQSRTVVPAR